MDQELKNQYPLTSGGNTVENVLWNIRDEHRTGLGLDWIGTLVNFVNFGLDSDCKMLHEFRIRTGFGLG